MMRRGAGFNADQAGWQLLKECQHVTPLELTTDDDIALRIDPVNLKDRLRNVETECRDRLHVWLLRIVGALSAPTSVELTCRWRRRPHHQKPPPPPEAVEAATPRNRPRRAFTVAVVAGHLCPFAHRRTL